MIKPYNKDDLVRIIYDSDMPDSFKQFDQLIAQVDCISISDKSSTDDPWYWIRLPDNQLEEFHHSELELLYES